MWVTMLGAAATSEAVFDKMGMPQHTVADPNVIPLAIAVPTKCFIVRSFISVFLKMARSANPNPLSVASRIPHRCNNAGLPRSAGFAKTMAVA
jgi:hypothetical protein